MTEMLDWLVASGERLTVVSILLVIIFVLFWGQQQPRDADGKRLSDRWGRPWWVPGWLYVDLDIKYTKLVEKTDTATEKALEKLEEYERERYHNRSRASSGRRDS